MHNVDERQRAARLLVEQRQVCAQQLIDEQSRGSLQNCANWYVEEPKERRGCDECGRGGATGTLKGGKQPGTKKDLLTERRHKKSEQTCERRCDERLRAETAVKGDA